MASNTYTNSVPHHIGLVGCGNWGRHILRDLVGLGCSVAVVAPDEASIDRARQGEASLVVRSVEDLPEVEGAVVAVPTVHHCDVVDALLPRRIPIFVEKPLTSDAASADRIATAAPDRVFVMDKWRYHPGVEMLRDLARSEELGPVVGIETTRVGWGRPHADTDAIWLLAPHDLSIVLEVLGSIPLPRLARADRAGDVPSGIVAVLGDMPWARIEVGSRAPERTRRIVLRCREGIAWLSDGDADRVQILRGYPPADHPPKPEPRPVSPEWPLVRELRVFVKHLEGGPPPRSSAAEGAMIVRTIADLRALAGLAEADPVV